MMCTVSMCPWYSYSWSQIDTYIDKGQIYKYYEVHDLYGTAVCVFVYAVSMSAYISKSIHTYHVYISAH